MANVSTSAETSENEPSTLLSPRLGRLSRALAEDGADRNGLVEQFWQEMESAGTPLIEDIPGDPDTALVTFLWRETEPTRAVRLYESVSWRSVEERMLGPLAGTNIWYLTWRVSMTVRAGYGFSVVLEGDEEPSERWPETTFDPLNRNLRPSDWRSGEIESTLVMPAAEALPWDLTGDDELAGDLHADVFESEILGNERPVWIYTPPGYDATGASYPLVVIFDGEAFHGAPRTLDALIRAGELPPLVAILVNQIGIRDVELPCNPDFSRAMARELVPWMRSKWNVTDDPAMTALNGCSFGGLCSAYTALKHPDVFGNVVMQSGSCWYHPSVIEAFRSNSAPSESVVGQPAATPTIISEYMASDAVPVRIYQECGDVENGPPPARIWQVFGNRWLHDILELKGYDTVYREFNGGHDDMWWRGTFADGMRWVFSGRQHSPHHEARDGAAV